MGVWVAGRYGYHGAPRILAIGGAGPLLGWIALASLSTMPVALMLLVLAKGALSFAVGSTLIAASMRAAAAAPTISGSFVSAGLMLVAAIVAPSRLGHRAWRGCKGCGLV